MLNSEFILNLENELHNQMDYAVHSLQNLGKEELLWHSNEFSWSIQQHIAHLNTYLEYYLPLMKQIVKNNKRKDITPYKPGFLGKYLNKQINLRTSKTKFTARQRHTPASNNFQPNTIADFLNYQEQLLDCIRQSTDVDLNNNKITLSIQRFIRLSLGDIYMFMIYHQERHLVKATSTLANEQQYFEPYLLKPNLSLV